VIFGWVFDQLWHLTLGFRMSPSSKTSLAVT
jgi:hypothetical protein